MICPPSTSGLCRKPRTLIQAYADDGRRGKLAQGTTIVRAAEHASGAPII
jgi:hypothetical protein